MAHTFERSLGTYVIKKNVIWLFLQKKNGSTSSQVERFFSHLTGLDRKFPGCLHNIFGAYINFQNFSLCSSSCCLIVDVSAARRTVPKPVRKTKAMEVKGRRVFGVPLLLSVQQTGEPLPPSILRALVYLRTECLDQVFTHEVTTRPVLNLLQSL